LDFYSSVTDLLIGTPCGCRCAASFDGTWQSGVFDRHSLNSCATFLGQVHELLFIKYGIAGVSSRN